MPGRILLGGGIGSGKSTAAGCFATLGAIVVSADDLGRRVLEPGTDVTRLVLERWPEAGDGLGGIDRAALAGIVFPDPDVLAELEAFTHPGIGSLMLEAADGAGAEVLVVELPVLRDLAGKGWPWVVVDAPEEVRVGRAVARGGRSEAQIREIMERQPSRGEWLAAADWVIDNSGDLAHLEDQCRRVWELVASA